MANIRAQFKECSLPASIRSYLAELVSSFFFVLATVGSIICARMVGPGDYAALAGTAVAQGLGLYLAVLMASDVSGGHVNPAVTFAFALGGCIGVPSAVMYMTAQVLGSIFACFILHAASAGEDVPTTRIAPRMTGFSAAVLEGALTFVVVCVVHLFAGPSGAGASGRKTGPAAVAVGQVTALCVLAASSLTGASMNPARSLGPAFVSDEFGNQAVYWVGPLIGAGVAALLDKVMTMMKPSEPEAPRGTEEMPR